MELAIGKIKLVGPVLIPSISVFETQGKLSEALVLQDSLNEPITLLSAHDVARHPDLAEKVAHFRDRGGVVFLDSGGYEASRIGRYVEGYREAWSIEDFESAISNCGYDLAASFDTFIGDDEPSTSFQLRLIDFLLHDHEFVEKDKLVPVVHIHDFTGKPLEPDKVVDLIDRVAAEVQPRFIAIPERELGDGFCQKHSLIKMITQTRR